eukprot:3589594-Rhodomonas_salina.1
MELEELMHVIDAKERELADKEHELAHVWAAVSALDRHARALSAVLPPSLPPSLPSVTWERAAVLSR